MAKFAKVSREDHDKMVVRIVEILNEIYESNGTINVNWQNTGLRRPRMGEPEWDQEAQTGTVYYVDDGWRKLKIEASWHAKE